LRLAARPIRIAGMSDVTRILSQIEQGDPAAAEQLLPLVYDELRNLAAAKLAHEKPGQTLQATALVHEAYLRLVGVRNDGATERERDGETGQASDPSVSSSLGPSFPAFDSRGHFFAAAAVAMRRILVENARRKQRVKHGGQLRRIELEQAEIAGRMPPEELLTLDEALSQLAAEDPAKAKLVELRFFVGMTNEEAADVLGISAVTAKRHWRYARAWLHKRLAGDTAALDSGSGASQNS